MTQWFSLNYFDILLQKFLLSIILLVALKSFILSSFVLHPQKPPFQKIYISYVAYSVILWNNLRTWPTHEVDSYKLGITLLMQWDCTTSSGWRVMSYVARYSWFTLVCHQSEIPLQCIWKKVSNVKMSSLVGASCRATPGQRNDFPASKPKEEILLDRHTRFLVSGGSEQK